MHSNFGTVLAKQSQSDEAIRQYREAVRRKPDYANAQHDLAKALERQSNRPNERVR